MNEGSLTPTSRHLSVAWAEAFLRLMDFGCKEIIPLVVVVTDITSGVANEEESIRQLLDEELTNQGLQSCGTVANTIFPESLWDPTKDDSAARLFTRYERIWPKVRTHPGNRRGVYFRRLTAFEPLGSTEPAVNQLQHILDTYASGNHRRSALQAAVFDPTRDHTDARRQGFPCLHQVGFLPTDDAGLSVTGFYSTQYLFDRAYGNLLGLARLGRFMAAQMGLELRQVICMASVAQRGRPSKKALADFSEKLRSLAPPSEVSPAPRE